MEYPGCNACVMKFSVTFVEFILGRGDRGGCKVGRLVQYDKSYFVQVLVRLRPRTSRDDLAGLRSAVEDRSATCSVASEEGDEVRRRTRKWGGRGNSDGDGDEGFEGPRGEGAAWRRPITGAEGEAGEADGCCSGVPPFGTVPSSTAPGRSPRRRCGTFGKARAPY